jgi:putative membrane protein
MYLAVFPGSTLLVALDRVPRWGEWMGGALLLLQGAVALCWLLACYGRRGALAAALVFALAWGVEHVGVQTGFPFGRYRYTSMLQPQLLEVVPLAIPFAWLMVVLGANDVASRLSSPKRSVDGFVDRAPLPRQPGRFDVHASLPNCVLAATLVLLLDIQIETVAKAINLARGYPLAGSVGLLVLLAAAGRAWPALVRRAPAVPAPALHSLHDAPDSQ